MMHSPTIKCRALIILLSAIYAPAAPASTPTTSSISPSPTVPYASDEANVETYPQNANMSDPEPIRGTLGASVLSTPNTPLELQNPSLFAPPTTDHGTM